MKHPWPGSTGVGAAYFDPQAGSDGDLKLPWCGACGRHAWPPRWRCRCGGTLEWRRTAGHGEVVSWSVVRRAVQPDMQDEVPYLVGFVALSPGVTVFTNLVGMKPEEMRAGLRVRSRLDVIESPSGERLAIPVFEIDPTFTDA